MSDHDALLRPIVLPVPIACEVVVRSKKMLPELSVWKSQLYRTGGRKKVGKYIVVLGILDLCGFELAHSDQPRKVVGAGLLVAKGSQTHTTE